MKRVFLFGLLISSISGIHAQVAASVVVQKPDSLLILSGAGLIQLIRNVSSPAYFSPTSIVHFANDSLSVPDSLMLKYDKVFWMEDSNGLAPSYDDILPNGFGINWPEKYTDGGFNLRVFRNYLVAWIGHDNPNPNRLLYVQAINPLQFSRISSLMMGGKESNTIVMSDQVDRKGQRYANWGLNKDALDLYDELQFNDSTGEYGPLEKEKAEAQFFKGLTAIITAFNMHLNDKIPPPGEAYKHCYSHFVWHQYGN